MIAVDTNVLLRYLVQDDLVQAAVATRVFENELTPEAPGFVTIVALLELDWVLRTQYGFSSGVVTRTVHKLMAATNLVFEHGADVESALDDEHGDLADKLLHATAKANGCTRTVTFDRKFARLDGVELLEA